MLSRRHIRIKVLQALYSFYRLNPEQRNLSLALKELDKSLISIYRLYLWDIGSILALHTAAEERLQLAAKKLRPTPEDLNPNRTFVDNPVLVQLAHNVMLNKQLQEHHISWREYSDMFKKLMIEIREDATFLQYLHQPLHNYADHKKIVKYVYANYICVNDFFHQHYEDMSIHWADDLDAAQMMTTKTIKTLKETSNELHPLVQLFKDKADEEYGPLLFRKVVADYEKNENKIVSRTKNWESDRIAIIDNLLMQMAITELQHFGEIPVKVTLNEYIELGKQYSTPKSANFINGVLDKLVADLKAENKIVKFGRGLL